MKLISIQSARAVWLVSLNQINPRGRNILPLVIALIERYKFEKRPDAKSLTEVPTKIVFDVGSFLGADGYPVYVGLTVHDDGLVVQTRSSTLDAEHFLEDMFSWLAKDYQLPAASELSIRKLYMSDVIVQLDRPLNVFNERVARFARSLESGLGEMQPKPMRLVNINFATDPGETNQQQAALRIEHAVGTSFRENKFYSSAPIHTHEHLRLLERFEEAAT